jgi:radical SAM protein with 4Fe4S-binding SPASM domain
MIPITRIEVELTEACNLQCRFCYNSCNPVTCSNPFEILDALALSGVLEIILTGGEPLLHPEFFKILEYAKSKFPRVMVQSNGTLLSDEASFGRLASYNPYCLNFSLHGPEEVHDTLTQSPGSHSRTVNALGMAIDGGIRTASNFVLTSINTSPDILRETVAILSSVGVKEMTLTRFIPCGIGKGATALSTDQENFVCALRILLDETNKNGLSLLLANSTPACLIPKDLHDMCNRCSFGYDKFYVDVHGNLLTCGMGRVEIGNLLEKPVAEVIERSPVCKSFLNNDHLPKKCNECPDLPICGGGCRAAAKAQNGVLSDHDPLVFNRVKGLSE